MKLQRFTLDAGSLGGRIDILRPLPSERREGNTIIVDPWGELASLRLVPEFATLIPIIDGESLSHAMHGHMRPLMERIGPEPKYQLKRIPEPHNECSLIDKCIMYDSRRCRPTSKKLPECWTPQGEEDARRAMSIVTLAWAENRYVVVIVGGEFVIDRVGG